MPEVESAVIAKEPVSPKAPVRGALAITGKGSAIVVMVKVKNLVTAAWKIPGLEFVKDAMVAVRLYPVINLILHKVSV